MIRKIPDDVQAAIDAKVVSGQYVDEGMPLDEAAKLIRRKVESQDR